MDELTRIAFRNIFRNTQRSLLTVIMVLLAVTVIILFSSFLSGMFANILEDGIRFSGHVRITSQDHDIKEKMMSLSGNVPDYSKIKASLSGVIGEQTIVGRLKFGSLIFKGDDSKQGLGYGIEPDYLKILKLKEIIYQGQLFNPNSKDEILIGRSIAESLNLQIGDKITLLVRTLYNSTWALNYRVVGFFDCGNTIRNKSFYISLSSAQELLDMQNRVTEIMVFGKSTDDTAYILNRLEELDALKALQITRWDKIGMGPILVGMVTIIATVVQFIFITLAGLGIANTIMMAILERKKEIGLLKSMGMYESEVVLLFIIEGILLGLVGTTIGLLIGGIGAYLMSSIGINLGNNLKGLPIVIGNIVYGGFNPGIFIRGLSFGLVATILATIIAVLDGVRFKKVKIL